MIIGDLYDAITYNDYKKDVVVVVDGNEIPMGSSYYIEDETVYWFKSENEFAICGKHVIWAIEGEAEDDCWDTKGFRGRNTYEDCRIRFINGLDFEDTELPCYEIDDIKVTDKIRLIAGNEI